MKKYTLMLSILSISMLQAIISGISPVLADIKRAFPDVSEVLVMQLLSLPFIFTVPASLISGKLSEKLSKKTILLFGITLTTVSGIIPMFVSNFYLILIVRIFTGIGVGLVIPFMVSLIVDFFEGSEREYLFGIQGTFVCIGSITYYVLGGLLGAINWHLNFSIFFIGLLVITLVMLYLPGKDKHENKAENKSTALISKRQLVICFLVFAAALLISVFTARLSFLITGEGIGNAATTGIITMFTSVGGLMAGLYFGKLSRILNRFVVTLAIFLAGLGIFIAANTHQAGIMMLAALILGSGSALSVAAFMSMIASASSGASNTFVTAVFMSSISLGMSGAPIFTSVLSHLVPSFSARGIYTLTAVLLFLYSLMSFLIISIAKKKSFVSQNYINKA
ncbi:putative MFS family arabinose efflux permease [Anaerobacterium chartisolvens]|uniref:Putative MFS family arabinose efflux permease n=1 Tax=Anaerobacterium chartisolvens TaxID=1297424 RepID=A0A369B675_9FIRM|nr:MFS transporter [Anaerobacterium chartisolvens]RCX16046.1 putative MFS family arabinose efflux permease [Anaerobacterium chartisolvens]